MNKEEMLHRIRKAVTEADRFMQKAELARRAIESNQYFPITGSKDVAAMKRASMDLTRALAELRSKYKP
jgi:hypothetical protein